MSAVLNYITGVVIVLVIVVLVQSNLIYPDLDYPDFLIIWIFSLDPIWSGEYLSDTIKIRCHILFITTALKSAVKNAHIVTNEEHSNEL